MTEPRQQMFSNKKLISMLIPVILEAVMASLVGMIDGIMVSTVGETAISGVALVGNISSMMVQWFICLAAGGAIVTSQYIGARNTKAAQRSAGQLILMVLFVSIAIGAIAFIFARPLLMFCFGKTEPEVMDNAVTYFKFMAVSYPFFALRNAGGAIFRCSGNTKVSLYISMIVNFVNIGGNAICLYGLGMGVEGVALPTVISRAVGAAIIMVMMVRSPKILSPTWHDVTHVHGKTMAKIVQLGIPTALEGSLFQLGKVGTVSMISGFGTYQIAANSVGMTLAYFSGIPSDASATVALTVVGQCVGAKNMKQIKMYTRKMLIWSYGCTAVIAIAMLLLRYQLLGLYSSLSAEAVELTADLMLLFLCMAIFFYPPSFFMKSPLRATNDSVYTMAVGVGSMLVVRLGLAYILCVTMQMGAMGVWIGMVADWTCRSFFYVIRWVRGKWKTKCGLDG